MNSPAADPGRFTSCHEPLTTTVVRNSAIAIVVAFVITFVRLHHLPATSAEWHRAFALAVLVLWITFGGHFVELIYLNGLRPKLAHWPDMALVFVRLGVWMIGGAILFAGGLTSQRLLIAGEFPPQEQVLHALLYGGPILVAVEFVVHALLLFTGKRSFWNLKG